MKLNALIYAKGTRRFKPVALHSAKRRRSSLFSASKHKFPGVQIEALLVITLIKKRLPMHWVMLHALTSLIYKNSLKQVKKIITPQPTISVSWHRKYHEELLHGKVGYQQVEVNNQGRIIRVLSVEPPTPGKDIVLNLDLELQLEAQRIIEGMRGAVVVTDVKTGGVLALYSNPSYDPNLFARYQQQYSALLIHRTAR